MQETKQETSDLLRELDESLTKLNKEWPEQLSAFLGFVQTVEKPGALEAKTKELIALALAINTHCCSCIFFHVKNALEYGATVEEVMEAGWVAVMMGGGPSLTYLKLVQQALDDLSYKS
jgi:AhpD family alkylhydroperoxidase